MDEGIESSHFIWFFFLRHHDGKKDATEGENRALLRSISLGEIIFPYVNNIRHTWVENNGQLLYIFLSRCFSFFVRLENHVFIFVNYFIMLSSIDSYFENTPCPPRTSFKDAPLETIKNIWSFIIAWLKLYFCLERNWDILFFFGNICSFNKCVNVSGYWYLKRNVTYSNKKGCFFKTFLFYKGC